jgi:hypothetical protein
MTFQTSPKSAGTTAPRLLRAAADLLAGDQALAERLGIRPALLARFMSGQKELPPELLLRTVDILLEAAESADPLPGASSSPTAGKGDA